MISKIIIKNKILDFNSSLKIKIKIKLNNSPLTINQIMKNKLVHKQENKQDKLNNHFLIKAYLNQVHIGDKKG
jgi:hypothetical protein